MLWLILGGDLRNFFLAQWAAKAGHEVQVMGMDQRPEGCEVVTPRSAKPADLTILPFPIAEVEGMVPTPLAREPLPLGAVAHLLKGKVWGGRPGEALREEMERGEAVYQDPNDLEDYAIANALPSAEGAIVNALTKAGCCLAGCQCLVVGYGRIGRILARLLKAWNAQVTVAARKPDARAWALAEGCQAFHTNELAERIGGFRFIFQTAPAMLLGAEVVSHVAGNALVSDLTRGGVDLETCEVLGLNAWRDSGIPGRYSPETAGKILYETMVRSEEP